MADDGDDDRDGGGEEEARAEVPLQEQRARSGAEEDERDGGDNEVPAEEPDDDELDEPDELPDGSPPVMPAKARSR